MTTAVEFMDAFEALFKTEKRRINQAWNEYQTAGQRPEAFSPEFGLASAKLNRELRAQCAEVPQTKEQEGERERLTWAYAYWWNRLHLLESLSKTKLGEASTKKNIEKGGTTLRGLIMGTVDPYKIHPRFLALIESLNHRKIEEAVVKQVDVLLKEEKQQQE